MADSKAARASTIEAQAVAGKLDSAYQACSKGHEQSPINIHGAHLNKTLQPIDFHYIAGPVTLENNAGDTSTW